MRRGRRSGRRRRGAGRRAAGRLRRQQLRPPRRVQLGPAQPLRAPPRSGRLRARRLHHRRRHRHAGLSAVGGAARGDRLRHRPRSGRAAARAAPAGRRSQRGRPRPVDRAVPAGRAERGGRLPPTRPGQPRPGAGDARRPDRRRRGRPRLPHRRRRHQPAGRARRRAGPGPGPRRRHRQVPPGPALDRVLREGAGGPVLALVRPRTLRPDLRGGRRRLPDRPRPLDRTAQHGLFLGPGGRGSARPGPPRLRGAAVRRRGQRLRADSARRAGRRRDAVPLLGQRVAAAPAGHLQPARSTGPQVGRPAGGPARCDRGRQLRHQHAPAPPARPARRAAGRGGDRDRAVGGQRPAPVRLRALLHRPPGPARRRRGRRRGDRDPPPCARGRGVRGPHRRQGGVRREAAGGRPGPAPGDPGGGQRQRQRPR